MTRTIAFFALGVLTACGGGQASNASANAVEATANQAASAPAAGLDGARALIDRIYAGYADPNPPGYDQYFTPELNRLIAASGEMDGGGLGYDPLCQCQDFENLTHAIESLVATDRGASARVRITNMGETRELGLILVRRSDAWRIADVHDGQTLLTRQLAAN